MDVWTYGDAVTPEKYKGRRLGWSDTWVRAAEGANPYAGPVNGFHCVIDVNSMELLEIEDTFSVERPEVMGEYVPRHIPERIRNASTRAAVEAAGHRPVGGAVVHPRRQQTRMAELVAAGGVQLPRGHDPARGDLQRHGRVRSIANRMSFAEMAVPYRDTSTDHYRRTAFDIGEWGIGVHDHLAHPGLRLPRRDPVPRRRPPRQQGRAVHDRERDLHPRGGQRRPLEARRPRRGRRGAPHAAADGVDARDGRELRVSRLLAVLPGRQHRMRGPRHRASWWSATSPKAVRTRAGRSSTTARTRRSTSTSWSPGSISTSTAPRTRCTRPRPRWCRWARTTRLGLALRQKNTPLSHRTRGQAGLRLAEPAGLEGRQRQHDHRTRHRPRLQARSRRRDPVDVRPGVADLPADRRDRAHRLGDPATPPTNAGLQGNSSTRARTITDFPSGPRPTGRSRTPTWCSGTPSGSTTFPGRRTGRSCLPTPCRSG